MAETSEAIKKMIVELTQNFGTMMQDGFKQQAQTLVSKIDEKVGALQHQIDNMQASASIARSED